MCQVTRPWNSGVQGIGSRASEHALFVASDPGFPTLGDVTQFKPRAPRWIWTRVLESPASGGEASGAKGRTASYTALYGIQGQGCRVPVKTLPCGPDTASRAASKTAYFSAGCGQLREHHVSAGDVLRGSAHSRRVSVRRTSDRRPVRV